MGKDNIVVFRTFNNLPEAYLVKGLLEENGLPCIVTGEDANAIYPLYNNDIAGISLSVFERDLPEAERILDELQEKDQ